MLRSSTAARDLDLDDQYIIESYKIIDSIIHHRWMIHSILRICLFLFHMLNGNLKLCFNDSVR